MPEFAEVEYFRRQWDPGIGEKSTGGKTPSREKKFFAKPIRLNSLGDFRGALAPFGSRGKQILLEFSGNNLLGLHLGMTGNMRIEKPDFRARKT